jgi:DNA-binding MarR family transcriptional regulator
MVLERMQSRGLIERKPNPHDRRSVQVTLTEPGGKLVKVLEPVARCMELGLMKRLSAADHAKLIRLLSKLADGPQAG